MKSFLAITHPVPAQSPVTEWSSSSGANLSNTLQELTSKIKSPLTSTGSNQSSGQLKELPFFFFFFFSPLSLHGS